MILLRAEGDEQGTDQKEERRKTSVIIDAAWGRALATMLEYTTNLMIPRQLPSSPMSFFAQRGRTFADLDFLIVDMLQHLAQVAHVEPLTAARAIAETIGFGDAVRVEARNWPRTPTELHRLP